MSSLVLTNRPARGNINTPFGPRPKPTPSSPAIHYGQDYGWGGGDTIYAAASGRVKSYSYSGAYGNRLVIDHGNGFETWYCHLQRNSVAAGVLVRGGQEVAVMGTTGNSTAKHLHFEVREYGVAKDPAPHFNLNSSAAAVDNKEEIQLTLPTGEDDMYPIYAKGDKNAAVYAIYLNAGGSGEASGSVYSARRAVEAGEFKIVSSIGFPHPKQQAVVVIPQAEFDAISKVNGSK